MRFFCLFSRLRALPKNTRQMPSAYALQHFPPSFFQKKFQKPRSRCRSSTHLTPRFRTDIFLSPAQRRFAARRQTDFRARLQFPQSSDALPRAPYPACSACRRPARYRTHGTLLACSRPRPATQRQGNTSVSLPAAATARQCQGNDMCRLKYRTAHLHRCANRDTKALPY